LRNRKDKGESYKRNILQNLKATDTPIKNPPKGIQSNLGLTTFRSLRLAIFSLRLFRLSNRSRLFRISLFQVFLIRISLLRLKNNATVWLNFWQDKFPVIAN
jgi:hypothetical protein